MLSRRQFIRSSAVAATFAGIPVGARSTPGPFGDTRPGSSTVPLPMHGPGIIADLARDEAYWQVVQQAFSVDRSLIHLNNGGVCPAPDVVQRAEQAHHLEVNRAPFYAHQALVAPQVESIRQRLAACFGSEAGEIALTRNTSEGMEICQLGVDLRRGDEIVTTEHDYPRMLNTWMQRAAREGIVMRTVPVPVPLDDPEALVDRVEAAFTSRTRLLMCCHMVDLTGQILPVRALADVAHRRGAAILVDGAQTFGHFGFSRADLACDFFATSLHKWLMGPQGTGMLFVARERIADVWPLMPCDRASTGDIRKFEDVGTQPPARVLALAEAIAFHRTIGADLKAARLRYLRDHWLEPLLAFDRVRLLTHLPDACALATIDVEGVDPVALRDHLWDRHRIRVRPIRQSGVSGIRVSPSVYTTLPELDRFTEIMTDLIRNGIPIS